MHTAETVVGWISYISWTQWSFTVEKPKLGTVVRNFCSMLGTEPRNKNSCKRNSHRLFLMNKRVSHQVCRLSTTKKIERMLGTWSQNRLVRNRTMNPCWNLEAIVLFGIWLNFIETWSISEQYTIYGKMSSSVRFVSIIKIIYLIVFHVLYDGVIFGSINWTDSK